MAVGMVVRWAPTESIARRPTPCQWLLDLVGLRSSSSARGGWHGLRQGGCSGDLLWLSAMSARDHRMIGAVNYLVKEDKHQDFVD